jgi:hypothetical protein
MENQDDLSALHIEKVKRGHGFISRKTSFFLFQICKTLRLTKITG